MKTTNFETILNNKEVNCYILENESGMRVLLSNYGARILTIEVPDKKNEIIDVTLGYENIDRHINEIPYFGAVIGRCANRISNGRFKLKNKTYQLNINDAPNHLHGGSSGFSHKVWTPIKYTDNMLKLEYISNDGEEFYPGKLTSEITFKLSEDNSLSVEITAKSDADTIVNFTMHPYFNLDGKNSSDVLNHKLKINANSYLSVDNSLLPLKKVNLDNDKVFDFREYKNIGQDINAKHEQLKITGGYDHNFILNSQDIKDVAVSIFSNKSGIKMDIYTNQPGLQMYSVNWESGSVVGKNKKPYPKHAGVCLEPQHFPDSPNHLEFPSVILEKDKTYYFYTKYQFTNKN